MSALDADPADPACAMEMCNGYMSCYGGSCYGGGSSPGAEATPAYQYVGQGAGHFEMTEVPHQPDSSSPGIEDGQTRCWGESFSRNFAIFIGIGMSLLFTVFLLVGNSSGPARHSHRPGQDESVLRGASLQTSGELVEHSYSWCTVPELADYTARQVWCCSHFQLGCGMAAPASPSALATMRSPSALAGVHPLPIAVASEDEVEVMTTVSPTTTAASRTWPYPSLFCWLIMQAHTREAELVRRQVQRKVGIFACAEHFLFSDYEVQVGEPTTLLGDISVAQGSWGSAMNTEPFLRAWDRIIQDGRFRRHDFVVKIDPDTVFLPARLNQHLRGVPASETCYFKTQGGYPGFLGALEIVSRSAVEVFGRRKTECTRYNQAANSGEDGFLQHCFNTLGVASRDDYGLLTSGPDCTRGTSAFHPFKDPDAFVQCLDTANR